MLAPRIIAHFPPHRLYTEVFGGAASVLMRKPRAYTEVYNDMDLEVVTLFRMLRDKDTAAMLREALRLTPFAREEFEKAYRDTGDAVELARRLVIRSFMGFGSNSTNKDKSTGFRGRSERSGTTPAHDWANYPEAMDAMTERLRGVVVENRPARDVLVQYDGPESLHYVDPPYVHETRKAGQQKNYRFEMTDGDHEELAETLHGLAGAVVLSGYPSPLYDRLYAGWDRVEMRAMADGARERVEVLWINEKAKSGMRRLI